MTDQDGGGERGRTDEEPTSTDGAPTRADEEVTSTDGAPTGTEEEPARADAESTHADVELVDRYATVGDCTGRTLVFDVENADAWVRSDTVLDVDDWR